MSCEVPDNPLSTATRRVIRPAGFFALSFGSMVGSGWIILLGDWLKRAAPGGALLALLAGGTLMALIGCCYAELAARLPRAGGEFLYALEGLGRTAAFIVGWFITLFLVSLCAFEATALAWLVTELFPAAQGQALYRILGEPVTTDALVLGLIGAAAVCVLNLRGVRSSVAFQRVVTFTFIAVMFALIVAGFVFGEARNLQPLFQTPDGHAWTTGAFWIFAMCAMLLNGFQSALYVIEERAPDVSVRAATLCMVGGIVGKIILLVSIASLAKTWNALLLMASRILLAQARAGMVPAAFGRLNERAGAPSNAILLVTFISIGGMLLGKGALIPIINMATICIAMILVLALVVLLKLRRQQPKSPGYAVPGGITTIMVCLSGAVLMAGFAVFGPLLQTPGHVPLEWMLMLAWGTLGLIFSRVSARA